jgi:electron transfer flavoprotein alpha subunit
MGNSVCVITEFRGGNFRRVSAEVASEGRRIADVLGGSVSAIAIGSGVGAKAADLGAYGVDKVYAADDPLLEYYIAETYVPIIADIVKKIDPAVVILPASVDGKDLGARLAAKLDASLAQDCIQVTCEGGAVKAKRPVFAGKTLAWCQWENKSLPIISVRPNIVDCLAPTGKKAEVEKVAVALPTLRSKVIGMELDTSGKVELTEAGVIVSGGRGMKAGENFAMLEELAKLLGGAVGATRSAVDAGWRPHSDQVGQTGKVVNPTLYIAAGISGAIQHLAGMGSSKFVVAVNKDPDAPIFAKADLGVVEDLFNFIPAFTEEVKKIKSAG